MPTYEYHCESCNCTWDYECSMKDKPSYIPCECGRTAEFRISSPMIVIGDDKPRVSKLKKGARRRYYGQSSGPMEVSL